MPWGSQPWVNPRPQRQPPEDRGWLREAFDRRLARRRWVVQVDDAAGEEPEPCGLPGGTSRARVSPSIPPGPQRLSGPPRAAGAAGAHLRISTQKREEMTGHVPEARNDESGRELRSRIVELRRKSRPHLFRLGDEAGPMALPRVLRLSPTTSGSIVHSGTGRAFTVAHVFGS